MNAKVEQLQSVVLDGPRFRCGDETQFISVASRGHEGWYGPIPEILTPSLLDLFAHYLLGCDVEDHKEINRRLQAAALSAGLKTDTIRWCIGAIDCAVWDLHGALKKLPVAQLLSETARNPVRLYASHLSADILLPHTRTERSALAAEGFALTKWSITPPPERAQPDALEHYIAAMREFVATCPHPVALDGRGRWSVPALSALLAAELLTHLWWLEDLLPLVDIQTYGQYRGA